MKIIKRSGAEEEFHISKIEAAIVKANHSVPEKDRLTQEQIQKICQEVTRLCEAMGRALNVEEIQDLVENGIMEQHAFAVARNYITYRYERALVRRANYTDKQILSRRSTACSGTIWPGRSARTSRAAFCCRARLWRRMTMA